ncbi:hypothetical protein LCGC14_1341810 [marine sediment metagenome]|uniref:Uncharacterized protein n=1 Tax=marine sediment metagenome TaxID=412755 RepID=A0A0F9NFR1_9ZZZZ
MSLEFKISNYLKLKLEKGETVIYIRNERFIQCKFVVLKRVSAPLENINSIDELLSLESSYPEDLAISSKISPEEKFWVHCSSFQVWSSYNYDTSLFDSSLAFPILKKLTEVGDLKAKSVFKEEIAKKLQTKVPHVLRFLLKEGYATYLNQEELLFSTLNNNEAETILKISKYTKKDYHIVFDFDELREYFVEIYRGYNELHNTEYFYSAFKGKAYELEILIDKRHPFIPKHLGDLCNLRTLYLYINNVGKMHEFNKIMNSLRHLKIFCFGKVILPPILNYFPDLKSLDIYGDISGLTHLEIDDVGIKSINKIEHNLRNVIFKVEIV